MGPAGAQLQAPASLLALTSGRHSAFCAAQDKVAANTGWMSDKAGPSLMHLSTASTEQHMTAGNKLSLAQLQRVQSMLPIPQHLLSKYHRRVCSELSMCTVLREMAND